MVDEEAGFPRAAFGRTGLCQPTRKELAEVNHEIVEGALDGWFCRAGRVRTGAKKCFVVEKCLCWKDGAVNVPKVETSREAEIALRLM
jgi:hypothetical protein